MSPPPSLSPPTSCVHQGKKKYASKPAIIMEPQDQDDPRRPLRGDTDPDSDSDSESLFERRRRRRCPPPLSYDSIIIREEDDTMDYLSSHKSHWIFLAVASGACAAFNGVFAKLYVIIHPSPSSLPMHLLLNFKKRKEYISDVQIMALWLE